MANDLFTDDSFVVQLLSLPMDLSHSSSKFMLASLFVTVLRQVFVNCVASVDGHLNFGFSRE